ncbi:hypothetical protein KAU11_11345, partial [Candidatus Babeliales bacterium]|nr:hypothetical protein [Candidatus Babeliales bacterium]
MNLERQNIVQYQLYSSMFGSVEIQNPRQWNEDSISYSRIKDSRRIEKKTLIDLEFFGNGAEMLSAISSSKGISEKVLLIKYERDSLSLSEEFELRYVQQLDMGTFKMVSRTNNVTIKATEGGLASDIENRKSDKYDLINDESADGVNIGAIKTKVFMPQPRGILLESLLEGNVSGYRVNSERYNENQADSSRTIPLFTTYTSDKEDVNGSAGSGDSQNTVKHNQKWAIGTSQPLSDSFFFRAERDKKVVVKLDLSFKVESVDEDHATSKEIYVEVRKMEQVGNDDELTEREVLFTDLTPVANIGVQRDLSVERTYDMKT